MKHSDHPEAYDLKIIDDDETYYTPFYEIDALDRNGEIGEYESLAFIENNGFR